MPSNREVLDAGIPAPPTDGTIPVEVRQYGAAYLAITGSAVSPSNYGTFLRRVPEVVIVSVTSHTCEVGPGAVMAIQAVRADVPGPKAMILTGVVLTGQVLVEPQNNGLQRLTFNQEDAVTQAHVYILSCPSEMIAALDAMAAPGE